MGRAGKTAQNGTSLKNLTSDVHHLLQDNIEEQMTKQLITLI
jgi:hypothetical protein